MTDLFQPAVAIELREEGVHSDHPLDPGGDSWWGIARASHPNETPWPPTRARALELYQIEYWTPCRCAELPWALALPLFDGAVQHGDATARAMLQHAAGITADGVFGPLTMAQLQRITDPGPLLDDFMGARGLLYAGNKAFATFGTGWMHRAFEVHRLALSVPLAASPAAMPATA